LVSNFLQSNFEGLGIKFLQSHFEGFVIKFSSAPLINFDKGGVGVVVVVMLAA
jgi:hypothetical protein